MSPRRPTKRAAGAPRADRPHPDTPPTDAVLVGLDALLAPLPALQPYERPYDPDAPSPEPGLGLQRAIHRAFGLTDPVEIEVRVLTTTPPGESKAMADALREDARWGLSTHATPAEVDAEAVRILHEMAGLVPPRWGPYPPDVAGETVETTARRGGKPPNQSPDVGVAPSAPPDGPRPRRGRRRQPRGSE